MRYVPEFIRNIALLFDVPVFFLMTGCAMAVTGVNSNIVVRQLYKLSISFTLLVLFFQIIFLDFSLSELLNALFLKKAYVENIRGIQGSYWFVPVYAVSIIISVIVLKYYRRAIDCILMLCIVYYFLKWKFNISIDVSFFNVHFQMFFFYTSLILFGYKYYNRNINKKIWIYGAMLCLMFTLGMMSCDKFSMQAYKFPTSFVYIVGSMISICVIMLLKDCSIIRNKESWMYKFIKEIFVYLGKNCLNFYMSQGISMSILYYISPYIKIYWVAKLVCMFLINVAMAISLGIILTIAFEYINKGCNKFFSYERE